MPSDNQRISFGKHRGRTFRDVYDNENPYFQWATGQAAQSVVSGPLRDFVAYGLARLRQIAENSGRSNSGRQRSPRRGSSSSSNNNPLAALVGLLSSSSQNHSSGNNSSSTFRAATGNGLDTNRTKQQPCSCCGEALTTHRKVGSTWYCRFFCEFECQQCRGNTATGQRRWSSSGYMRQNADPQDGRAWADMMPACRNCNMSACVAVVSWKRCERGCGGGYASNGPHESAHCQACRMGICRHVGRF